MARAVLVALGMPVIFAGAHVDALAGSPILLAMTALLSLLVAGAVVGAVHGGVLVWLLAANLGEPAHSSHRPAT